MTKEISKQWLLAFRERTQALPYKNDRVGRGEPVCSPAKIQKITSETFVVV
ncbi:MAG: hypothetical protein AAFQ07_17670 [Chloroflexota bacterium]